MVGTAAKEGKQKQQLQGWGRYGKEATDGSSDGSSSARDGGDDGVDSSNSDEKGRRRAGTSAMVAGKRWW